MTNQDAINQALGLISVVEAGSDANATDSADMLNALNQMMAAWAVDGKDLQFPPQDTLSDTFPVVGWAQEAVISSLALRASAMFQSSAVTPALMAMASNGVTLVEKILITRDMKPSSASGLSRGSNGGVYDIQTGLIS